MRTHAQSGLTRVGRIDLAKELWERFDLPVRFGERVIDYLADSIVEHTMHGHEVVLRRFGKFRVRRHRSYFVRLGRMGESVRLVFQPFRRTRERVREVNGKV